MEKLQCDEVNILVSYIQDLMSGASWWFLSNSLKVSHSSAPRKILALNLHILHLLVTGNCTDFYNNLPWHSMCPKNALSSSEIKCLYHLTLLSIHQSTQDRLISQIADIKPTCNTKHHHATPSNLPHRSYTPSVHFPGCGSCPSSTIWKRPWVH